MQGVTYSTFSTLILRSFIYLVKSRWRLTSPFHLDLQKGSADLPLNQPPPTKPQFPKLTYASLRANSGECPLPLATPNLPPRNSSCPVFIFIATFSPSNTLYAWTGSNAVIYPKTLRGSFCASTKFFLGLTFFCMCVFCVPSPCSCLATCT